MNNLFASPFTPSQTAIVIIVAVVGVALIVLNIVLAYLFHKRGERKLYDLLMQQQREMLLKQLDEMRAKGTAGDDVPAEIQPFLRIEEEHEPVVREGVLPEQSVPAEEPAEPSVQEITESAEEPADEEPEEELSPEDLTDDEENAVEEEVVIGGRVVRYNRSFEARIIQASDEVKTRYEQLKNYILSYNGVKSRISWKKESFRLGRNTFATFTVRGKTLCLNLATDPKQFEETKYKVIDLSVRSPKSKQPCCYRINGERKLKYAEELVDILMSEFTCPREYDYVSEPFRPEYETTSALIERELIKVLGDSNGIDFPELDGVRPEEPVQAIADPAEVSEPEAAEEVAAAVEIPAEPEETKEELPERDFEILEEVDEAQAETFSDETAKQLVEVKVVRKKNTGKKGIVNIDSLSQNYEAGAHVTVESLQKKGLVAKDVKVIKVLAKGSVNKPLIVEADDFSLSAVKMIVLTGGRVIRRASSEDQKQS